MSLIKKLFACAVLVLSIPIAHAGFSEDYKKVKALLMQAPERVIAVRDGQLTYLAVRPVLVVGDKLDVRIMVSRNQADQLYGEGVYVDLDGDGQVDKVTKTIGPLTSAGSDDQANFEKIVATMAQIL